MATFHWTIGWCRWCISRTRRRWNFSSKPPPAVPAVELPSEIKEDADSYGFIGRDNGLLELERAMRRPPAGILVHGLAGVGKTTLAKGFVRWLADTHGLSAPPFWFSFNDIRSSEYVINRLVEALFGTAAMAAPTADKLDALVRALKQHPLLLVWDNFESVSGIPGTEVQALMPEADRQQLKDLLYRLRGGQTKVLITSRSPESAWLNRPNCYRLPLRGLYGEERWDYCNAIVRDLGLPVDRADPEAQNLMDLLDGHPLAMRALLLQLADTDAKTLAGRLRHRLEQTDKEDDQAKLFAALGFIEEALPDTLKPLLIPLALHERFVQADVLEAMAKTANAPHGRSDIDQLCNSLETAGLLHGHGQGIYAMHPALTGFLRQQTPVDDPAAESWRRAFVDFMGSFADHLAPKELHEQRVPFHLHGANFHAALAESEQLGMEDYFAALTQALGFYAQNQRDFISAQRYFERLAEHQKRLDAHKWEAVAYHQLGMIAQERREFGEAERWYRKSLAIKKKHGNEHGAATTYHQLGRIAQERRDFIQAGNWYLRSIKIFLRTDPHSLQIAAGNFLKCLKAAPPEDQAALNKLWEEAVLGPLPSDKKENTP